MTARLYAANRAGLGQALRPLGPWLDQYLRYFTSSNIKFEVWLCCAVLREMLLKNGK